MDQDSELLNSKHITAIYLLGIVTQNDSLKFNTDYYVFRDRQINKDVSTNRFRSSMYLSK